MFIAHFGVGLAAKAWAPRVSLGTLLLAGQFIDLLWPTFLLLGWEQVRIAPGATTVTPLIFVYYPFSHSLLAVAMWAVLVGGAAFLLRRDWVGAVVVGCVVLSHWILDALVHQPDLPLLPGGSTLIGLNGWASLPLTLALEAGVFMVGVWMYGHTTSPRDTIGSWGFGALVCVVAGVYLGNVFGPPPPSELAIAWAGQLQWLFVAWGYWLDAHREVRHASQAAAPGFDAVAQEPHIDG